MIRISQRYNFIEEIKEFEKTIQNCQTDKKKENKDIIRHKKK